MAHFNITWFNTAVIINPNAAGQRVSHRQKSLGGSFVTTGYTPANDLPKTASASQSPVLADNVVWEFKVEAICTEGGPTINDNGLQEGLKFACLEPVISNIDTDSATIALNVLNTDIASATFILHKAADNVVVAGPTTIARVGNSITWNVTGLDPETEYYVETVLYAIVNGSQIASNDPGQLNASCISENFTTLPDTCAPITDLDVTSIDIT
jgi:hypothetical protein